MVELTYNYGKDYYDIGTAYGNFGIVVEDVQKIVDLAKAKGLTNEAQAQRGVCNSL